MFGMVSYVIKNLMALVHKLFDTPSYFKMCCPNRKKLIFKLGQILESVYVPGYNISGTYQWSTSRVSNSISEFYNFLLTRKFKFMEFTVHLIRSVQVPLLHNTVGYRFYAMN